MTDLKNQRRLAADILKCGVHRVRVASTKEDLDDITEAVTRDDIRELIQRGVISKNQKKGVSRGRARHRLAQKKKGRRRGHGSREGAKYARLPKKERWMITIRPLRNELKTLRDNGDLSSSDYRKYYRRSKGGMFRSRAHLRSHLVMDGVVKKEE